MMDLLLEEMRARSGLVLAPGEIGHGVGRTGQGDGLRLLVEHLAGFARARRRSVLIVCSFTFSWLRVDFYFCV